MGGIPMKCTRGNREAAFTMLELIVALGIIVMVTVISIPTLGPMLGGRSVDGAADAVKAALMHARYSAIAQGREGLCWAIEGTTCDIGRVTASSPPLAADRFADSAKAASWSRGQWNGYWASWVSSAGVLYTRRILPVDGMPDNITLIAESNWDPVPEVGAIYLVGMSPFSTAPALPFVVGSGTPRARGATTDQDEMRWDKLPDFAAIFPYRIDGATGHGIESTIPVFPIVFTSTGRATFAAEHVTMRIYDRQTPDAATQWRYVRVYRNTGRVAVGRTLDELN